MILTAILLNTILMHHKLVPTMQAIDSIKLHVLVYDTGTQDYVITTNTLSVNWKGRYNPVSYTDHISPKLSKHLFEMVDPKKIERYYRKYGGVRKKRLRINPFDITLTYWINGVKTEYLFQDREIPPIHKLDRELNQMVNARKDRGN